ncbi:uncharacterized protein LOC131673160 isoform X2 [Phymastichus coffea]|uniref:uncharacterized protein LOC131673160 isoform X2 n=1 Tax=Phymastichus coffea TaxID=108790 RepID=UPI00273B255E|nr:uncharacterized protein LOC131673160 isoform X2 [Phymastichus coffea]
MAGGGNSSSGSSGSGGGGGGGGGAGPATTTAAAAAAAATRSAMPEAAPTLSEREQLKIEFYKTYDVMTGVRIAATLGGFFSLMVLLVVYKSRCKSNRQLEDPRLTAAAEAAVAEAEAEERALAAAIEALARQQPQPARGPRRSLCVEVAEPRPPLAAPRFASVGGCYDSLLLAAPAGGAGAPQRRCSSVTCSSTASSYLERRGSAAAMPCLPAPPAYPRQHGWRRCRPVDIQVTQPTPELSPCASEAGLCPRRAPLASMGSVDPPEADSLRSLGSDSVFAPPDTEDEVSGFSTDSSDGPVPSQPGRRQRLGLPPGRRVRPPAPDRWDGCAGCVPRRRAARRARLAAAPTRACMTISASVDAPRSPVLSTTTSSSQNSAGANVLCSPPPSSATSPIELRHRPQQQQQQQQQRPRPNSSPVAWSQETLF